MQMQVQSITKASHVGETTVSYDIHISVHPASNVTDHKFYDGDIHVWLPSGLAPGVISIYTSSGWVTWTPGTTTQFSISGITTYPCPCPQQGLRYVGSLEELRHTSSIAPSDMSILSCLISTDVQMQVEKATMKHRGTANASAVPSKVQRRGLDARPRHKRKVLASDTEGRVSGRCTHMALGHDANAIDGECPSDCTHHHHTM